MQWAVLSATIGVLLVLWLVAALVALPLDLVRDGVKRALAALRRLRARIGGRP